MTKFALLVLPALIGCDTGENEPDAHEPDAKTADLEWLEVDRDNIVVFGMVAPAQEVPVRVRILSADFLLIDGQRVITTTTGSDGYFEVDLAPYVDLFGDSSDLEVQVSDQALEYFHLGRDFVEDAGRPYIH